MLVLSRKQGERVVIGRDIVVTVLSVQNGRIKLGFSGPAEVPIHREEVRDQIEAAPGIAVPGVVSALAFAECA
jgi:carbon storage regulator